jgi:hypothetical protein
MIIIMHHKQATLFLLLLFLVLGLVVLPVSAQAPVDDQEDDEGPTAVSLVYFLAEAGDNRVFLEWETATEIETAGFIIKRSSIGSDGPFEQLFDLGDEVDGTNDGFIESRGNPQIGSYYTAIDSSAQNGDTYWYQLVEISQDNMQTGLSIQEVFVEPRSIIPTVPSNGTSTLVPTSTDIPTQTPIPSETPTPTNTPTIDPAALTPSAEPQDTAIPPTATVTPRPPGPTPTQFVFPSATPAGGEIGGGPTGGSVDVAAAAGLPGQQGYPASGSTATPFANVTAPAQFNNSLPVASPAAYPDNGINSVNGDSASPVSPGSGNARGIDDPSTDTGTGEAEEAQESGTTASRIILWLGLAGGLLILIGGIFFSIALATRRT